MKKLYRYLIAALIYTSFFSGFFTYQKALAYQEAFSQFNFNQQEETYNKIISRLEDDASYDILNHLSNDERVNLLAYTGMIDYEHIDPVFLARNKELITHLLPLTQIQYEDIHETDINIYQPLITKHAKKMILSNRYNNELKRLYPIIAQRKPLSFWQTYDLFKNMLAFGRKNNNLRIGSPHLKQLNSLEQMLEDDINYVAKQIGIKPLNIRFDYDRARAAAAWYNTASHEITINLSNPNLTWSRLVGEILWHELFHAFQNSLVEQHIFSDRSAQLSYFNKATIDEQYQIWLAAIYNANISAYQISEHNFNIYSQQPLEKHASYFGRNIYTSIMKIKF